MQPGTSGERPARRAHQPRHRGLDQAQPDITSLIEHTARLAAWVFVAIAGAKPEHGDRLLLHEVLLSADYFEDAEISKGDLEHGVRDLLAAGLIRVEGSEFALTDAGRVLNEAVWREYDSWWDRGPVAYLRKFLTLRTYESTTSIAARRLKSVPCAAADGWSVAPAVFDAALSRFREEFDANARALGYGPNGPRTPGS